MLQSNYLLLLFSLTTHIVSIMLSRYMYKLYWFVKGFNKLPSLSTNLIELWVTWLIYFIQKSNDKLRIANKFNIINIICPAKSSSKLHSLESSVTFSNIVSGILLRILSKCKHRITTSIVSSYTDSM